jgi:hypothetical protein
MASSTSKRGGLIYVMGFPEFRTTWTTLATTLAAAFTALQMPPPSTRSKSCFDTARKPRGSPLHSIFRSFMAILPWLVLVLGWLRPTTAFELPAYELPVYELPVYELPVFELPVFEMRGTTATE